MDFIANYYWLMYPFSEKVGNAVPRVPAPLHPCIANVFLRNCSLSISSRYFRDLKRCLRTFS